MLEGGLLRFRKAVFYSVQMLVCGLSFQLGGLPVNGIPANPAKAQASSLKVLCCLSVAEPGVSKDAVGRSLLELVVRCEEPDIRIWEPSAASVICRSLSLILCAKSL